MDYSKIQKSGTKIKLGIVGASEGFGYTTLAQIKNVSQIDIRVVSSIDIEGSYQALLETGYDENRIIICRNVEEINKTNEDDIIIVDNYQLVLESGINAVVESTGNLVIGTYISEKALTNGINVYMVSKETDSFAGPYFNQLAYENNAVYALVNGDQPRNLVDLYSWGQLVGLNIVAAGKSSEYDFVWDRESGQITYTDGNEEYENAPELLDVWKYKDNDTLDKRQEILQEYTKTIAADICEMNTVSNVTGLLPATPALNYPIAKVNELADIFIPKEDGGVLDRTGVVDVFYQLREKNEASFAGGVFLIFELKNEIMIDLLRSKGHVVSKNGKYGSIYQPYHMMGVEAPASIILGHELGVGTREDTRQVSVMVGVAEENIDEGHTFEVYGHHHEIKGITPRLFEQNEVENAVPFYLLDSVTLKNDVKKGDKITLDDIETDFSENDAFKAFQKGLEL